MEHVTFTPDEEQYIVHNTKEVIQILTHLVKQKANLKASFNHGDDIYLTTIISVDDKNHTVHLDIGRDEEFNRRLLASQSVVFCKDDDVMIKWTSTHISEVSLKDGKAIRIALPKNLIRLQRREFYRFATPIVNPVCCLLPIADKVTAGNLEVLELSLVDVSLGGIGIVVTEPVNPVLYVGASFDNCKISFPDIGVTNLTLKVRNTMPIHTKDGQIKHRIGLQYIEPSRSNEGLINRYVFVLERQEVALANRQD